MTKRDDDTVSRPERRKRYALPPMIVNASLAVGIAILFEAGLNFPGLGDPNVMSWGYLIGSSRTYILQAWWTVTFPGLATFLTVLNLT